MKSKSTIVFVISLILSVVVLVALVLFLHLISLKGKELANAAEEIRNLRGKEQSIVALDRLVRETEGERERLNGYVLSKSVVPEFITNLESDIAAQGVQVTTVDLTEIDPIEGKRFGNLVITLNLEGSRSALMRIYEMIETLPYHSYVPRVNLEKTENPTTGAVSWESSVQISLTLVETI